jgi:WhiB family redox-sensing transcriptional regulator
MSRQYLRRRAGSPVAVDEYWHLRARCRGVSPDYFYGADNESRDLRVRREQQAKQICRSCPVLGHCRSYAVNSRESFGIWGALTPRERQRLALADS